MSNLVDIGPVVLEKRIKTAKRKEKLSFDFKRNVVLILILQDTNINFI